jgi:hypothetical protein
MIGALKGRGMATARLLLLGLACFLALSAAGSLPASADKPAPQEIPLVGIATCIDFDNTPLCGPEVTPEITAEHALRDEQTGSDTCADSVDNDADGRADRSDTDCRITCKDFGVKERCTDRDRDGWLHYVEVLHGSDPGDGRSTPEALLVAGSCGDGVDNDLDGEADETDLECGAISDCIDFDDASDCSPF